MTESRIARRCRAIRRDSDNPDTVLVNIQRSSLPLIVHCCSTGFAIFCTNPPSPPDGPFSPSPLGRRRRPTAPSRSAPCAAAPRVRAVRRGRRGLHRRLGDSRLLPRRGDSARGGRPATRASRRTLLVQSSDSFGDGARAPPTPVGGAPAAKKLQANMPRRPRGAPVHQRGQRNEAAPWPRLLALQAGIPGRLRPLAAVGLQTAHSLDCGAHCHRSTRGRPPARGTARQSAPGFRLGASVINLKIPVRLDPGFRRSP